MNPPYNSPSVAALLFLDVAIILLQYRQFEGSKEFATHAQGCDPNLEPAYQIQAITDTLLTADKARMNNHNVDWYAILQVGRGTNDIELISSRYQRLAQLLNPQLNTFPFAEDALKLVQDAWSLLSDASRKSQYDNDLGITNNSIVDDDYMLFISDQLEKSKKLAREKKEIVMPRSSTEIDDDYALYLAMMEEERNDEERARR